MGIQKSPKRTTLLKACRYARVWRLGLVAVWSALTCGPSVYAQQSLSLSEAIHEALASASARIAEALVDSSRGQVRQAGLHPNPRLYLQSEDIRPWANNFSFANQTEDYGYLGETFELDGKRSKRMALAQANLRRSDDAQRRTMQEIVGAAAASYWSATVNDSIAELLKRDLIAVDQIVQFDKERVDAGATKGVDLIRMQVERDRIALSLGSAERDADLGRIELSRRIGRPVARDLRLSDDITKVASPLPMDIQTALEQRADLAEARDQVQAAEADLKLQHSLAWPDPDVLAGYKRNSGADTLFTSVQIPLPIRNRNQGEIQRAEAQVRLARATLEKTELAVRADVEAATHNFQREQEMVVQTLPELRTHAQQNLDILTEAYRLGGVDLLRYIDAERTRIEVEVTALRTLAEYQQSVLRLQLAYGGRP